LKKLLMLLCAVVSLCAYAQTPGAPTMSPAGGTYSSTQMVALSCGATAGGKMFYTVDGSVPDYTSTPYAGPIAITGTTTLKAICGVAGTTQLNSTGSTAFWKAPDFRDAGASSAPASVSNPQGPAGTGNGQNGVLTGSNCHSGGHCLGFFMTPGGGQTDVLWAKSSSVGRCDHCTWMFAHHWIKFDSTPSTFENDNYNWDLLDHLNFQGSGQLCTGSGCPSGHSDLDVGGNASAHWTATNIRPVIAANVWHEITKLEHWKLSELSSRPCVAQSGTPQAGNHFPCMYWDKWKLDGATYDLQHGVCTGTGCTAHTFSACGQSNGCTIASEPLSFNVGYATDQFQTDAHGGAGATQQIVDSADFIAYYDPSPVASATYSFGGTPTANQVTFSPESQSFNSTITVTLSTTTPSATLYYTLDGTVPTTSSSVYSVPLTVTATTTVTAIATASGLVNSSPASATYSLVGATVTDVPTALPPPRTYFSAQTVTLSDATSGAVICYTTDGTMPAATTAGTCSTGHTYTTPISVSTSQTITAIGTTTGLSNSAPAAFVYAIAIATPGQSGNIDSSQIKSAERLGKGIYFQMTNKGLFSTLPTCNTAEAGDTATVTDPSTTTYDAVESGTGTAALPYAHVRCDGTNWVVN
jgi:hypothetical protein